MFSSEKCKYFACDLIFKIMSKFFHTAGSNNTSGEIGEQSFGYTFFCRPWILMSNIEDITEIVIVHLSDLEDGLLRLLMQFEVSKYRAVSIISKMFTSFSFSKCDITRITKVTQVERHINHFEQTLSLKLFKCEEKVNYLHDFCSRPSIWILRINR